MSHHARIACCQWPGCLEPRHRPTHSNAPFCTKHRDERKRLMAKLRTERWRAKFRQPANELERQYDQLEHLEPDPNVALAVKLLKGHSIP